ncbi:hypothetical protein MXD81_05410 [Microbacteriaceae bacterium K1510]|nr:hypothetical protein [Microbacteriaceae bacterium K1510]
MPPLSPNPHAPSDFASAQVLTRFLFRTAILSAFALLSTHGFAKAFEGLLTFAVLYCVLAGGIRAEWPLRPSLTHYDEAAAYSLIAILTKWLS